MDRKKAEVARSAVYKTTIQAPSHQEDRAVELLFVNVTGNDSEFKFGGRDDIRSHVRKHATRSRQRDKAISRPQNPALASKTDIISEYQVPLPHDDRCSSKLPTAFTRLDCSSQVSGHLDYHDSIPQNDGSAQMQDPKIYNYEVSSSENTLGGSTTAANIARVAFQVGTQPRCKGCDQQYNAEPKSNAEANEQNLVRAEFWRTMSSVCSPVGVLGAGRVDPFMSYPVDKPKTYLHDSLDHISDKGLLVYTYGLPGLVPDDDPQFDVNPVSKAWFSSALTSPLLFHALVFAGSIHLDFLRWSRIFPDSPRALSHKITVLEKLKEAIADPEQALRDEVIMAIIILASHEAIDVRKFTKTPFQSPLSHTLWIDVYGSMIYVPEHIKAISDLVALKGGLEKVEFRGLAEIIAISDIISATNLLSKPFYPQLRCTETWIAALKAWAASPARMPTRIQGSAFHRLKELGLTGAMLEVFDEVAAITLAIDSYVQGKLSGLRGGEVARTRTAIQHRLLSLPGAEDLEHLNFTKLSLYECCRLSVLIYSIAVVFPIPNPGGALHNLVRRLKISIEGLESEDYRKLYADVLLWALILGGIAALDMLERTWFVSKLSVLRKEQNLHNWKSVEDILECFLWLESACGAGGILLWSEVTEWR
ncbi:hypothetical protein BP5796_08267 [Coleophoma crateriformis]|uniref:Transcription factor domain-containing protein n=1 Tax=Coleophoma crateriformis TaxID=565419 RepID=A0A3D8RDT9_9HELO|nr:hypothetical protein BP5796_08267 [Coleophoma crateriformis]